MLLLHARSDQNKPSNGSFDAIIKVVPPPMLRLGCVYSSAARAGRLAPERAFAEAVCGEWKTKLAWLEAGAFSQILRQRKTKINILIKIQANSNLRLIFFQVWAKKLFRVQERAQMGSHQTKQWMQTCYFDALFSPGIFFASSNSMLCSGDAWHRDCTKKYHYRRLRAGQNLVNQVPYFLHNKISSKCTNCY